MVFDSQTVFRMILEAMANPGRILSVKEYVDTRLILTSSREPTENIFTNSILWTGL